MISGIAYFLINHASPFSSIRLEESIFNLITLQFSITFIVVSILAIISGKTSEYVYSERLIDMELLN